MSESSHTAESNGQELELVIAAQRGDTQAFEQLVRRYSGLVFAVAYARTTDRESAEDLVQEVFLRAYTGLRALTQPRYFATWLSRIARNLATDWQRTGQRQSRAVALLSLEEVAEMSDPRADAASMSLEIKQQELALGRALQRLSPEEREILLLHYAEEWSLTDISKKLNVHRTTVGRHLEHALDQLRADVVPLVRESCRAGRSGRKLPAKAAAAVAAFALLPTASRAHVVSQLTAVPAANGVLGLGAGSAPIHSATILKITSAATAAGGSIIMKKTSVAAVVVLIGLLGAGYYSKDRISPHFRDLKPSDPGAAILATLPVAAAPGAISIKPSTSSNTGVSVGNGSMRANGVDLQNAIGNAFPGYGPGRITFNNVDPHGPKKDIAISAPAGQPQQLEEILRREIPKAYGVKVTPEERELDVLVMRAPQGDKQLKPSTSNGGARVKGNEFTMTGISAEGLARNLGGNLGILIVNETGLTGSYDIILKADLHNKQATIDAVRNQLGLELTPDRRKTKVLVVDKDA